VRTSSGIWMVSPGRGFAARRPSPPSDALTAEDMGPSFGKLRKPGLDFAVSVAAAHGLSQPPAPSITCDARRKWGQGRGQRLIVFD
jgi:hypothetical protein